MVDQGVLSADQRKSFRQMTGPEFKMEFGGFGGAGAGLALSVNGS